MKTRAVLCFAVIAVLACSPSNFAEQPAPKSNSSHEILEAKVLKVFAAEDDGYRFRAYLVEWNGQEVVISDPLSRSQYKEGDSVPFMVHRHRLARTGESLLDFILMPDRVREIERAVQRRAQRSERGDLEAAKNQQERFYALGDAAKMAMDEDKTDDARRHALELEKLASTYKSDWNYGNAIQVSNQVLGRIAVADGDIDEAKRSLLASADSEGSPQMNSFGPNMLLAKELLEKGERETVLEYFKLCGKFWDLGEEKLAEWSELVKQGKTPDFGANLKY